MDKTCNGIQKAIEDVTDGSVIAFGGFFSAGKPYHLTKALTAKNVKDLTIVTQQVGVGNDEILELITNNQVKKAICSYPFPRSARMGVDHKFEQAVRKGEIDLEVYPIGTFAEKLRCAGAGIPAFYTLTGVDTVISEGKEVRCFDGKKALLETALEVDFAFIHAWKGDKEGNLLYHCTAQNYNNVMAMAAKVTIAEVEYLVEPGDLNPNCVHTPGIFVKRVIETGRPEYKYMAV